MSEEPYIVLKERDVLPTLVLAVGFHAHDQLAKWLGHDYRITGMVTVLDALPDQLREDPPDVALVSRHLPGGSAPLDMILPQLRSAAPQTRFVIITGGVDDDTRRLAQLCAQHGIFNLITEDTLELKVLRPALSESRTWNDLAPLLS